MTSITERLRGPMPLFHAEEEAIRKEAANEIGRLEEIIQEAKPDTWSFDTLLYVGRRLLRDVYPADIFTGESGDSGPQYVVALREAIARIDAQDKLK